MTPLNNKLLKDFLTGRATPRQLERIDRWLSESEEHQRWLFRAEELYHAGRANPYADEARIMRAELRLVKALSEAREAVAGRHQLRRAWRYAAAIASLIIMAASVLYFSQGRQAADEIVAVDGIRKVVLSDGSLVCLNVGARLQYPREFSGRERKVYLSGEARFEVSKDSLHPFVVRSEGMEVRVLGTIFNFKTDCSRYCEEVTLQEGMVEAVGLGGEGKIVLQPNQKAVLDRHTRSMKTEQVYAPLSMLWYSRKIPFSNMHITDIIRILGHDYHEQIMLSGVDVNATYSGVLRQSETIDSVLDNLRFVIPFTYQRHDGCIYISGNSGNEE